MEEQAISSEARIQPARLKRRCSSSGGPGQCRVDALAVLCVGPDLCGGGAEPDREHLPERPARRRPGYASPITYQDNGVVKSVRHVSDKDLRIGSTWGPEHSPTVEFPGEVAGEQPAGDRVRFLPLRRSGHPDEDRRALGG